MLPPFACAATLRLTARRPRAGGVEPAFRLCDHDRRKRTLAGGGDVVAEVIEIFSPDDCGVQSSLGNGKAHHELNAAHAIKQLIQPCLVPAAAKLVTAQHVVALVPIGRCTSGDTAADDNAGAGGGSFRNDVFMLALQSGIGNLENIEHT